MPIARDEVQSIAFTASAGTWTVNIGYGATAALPYNATPYAVGQAINAVAGTPPYAVRVSGSASYHVVHFKGPTLRHTTRALLTVNDAGLIATVAPEVTRLITGQPGDQTGIRLTGRRGQVSVKGDGSGNLSSLMAGATSFTFFARLRLYVIAGDQAICGLTDVADGQHANLDLGLVGNPDGPNITIYGQFHCNNGAATERVSLVAAQVADPTAGGYRDATVCFTGVLAGGVWTLQNFTGGQSLGVSAQSSAGYGQVGTLGVSGLRFCMGCVADWGAPSADSDVIFDDVYLWKNRVLGLAEVQNLTNGAFDVEDFYPADLVLCIDGDDELGQTVVADAPGIENRAHPDFDTSAANAVFTGTATYGIAPVVLPVIPLEATVLDSGQTIAFAMKAPAATAIAPIGTEAQHYPEPTFHPSIRVNGGAAVPLENIQFIKILGPYYATYSLTGPNGVLATPIAEGDAVTFSVPQAWLRMMVDGAAASTLPYTDEPATVEVGVPYVMPAGRTMKFGNNLKSLKHFNSWRLESFSYWSGGTIDPSTRELTDVSTTANMALNESDIRTPGWGWSWDEDPAKPYMAPSLPPGRYCLTMDNTSTFNWGGASANPDTITDFGVAPAYGPWQAKYVSFCNLTDVTPIAGSGAMPHRVYFTVSYGTGLTGHAVPDSVGGDDFVRPSPAIGSYLVYIARGPSAPGGVGLAGPRTNLNLYHLGPVGAEWFDPADGMATVPEFYPPFVDMLTQAKSHTLRFAFDTFQTFTTSVPGLDFVARWDEADRNKPRRNWPVFPSGYVTPIVGVSNYTEGGANLGLKPPNYYGVFAVIETADPHRLRAGASFTVDGGSWTLPVADNGVGAPGSTDDNFRDAGMTWNLQVFCALGILSPTRVLIFGDTSKGLHADVLLATSPTTAGVGNLSVFYHNSNILPDEAIRLGREVGSDIWINMPVAFSDADVTETATVIAGELAGTTQRVVFEVGNELWNNIFYPKLHSLAQTGSMPGSGATFSATASDGAITGASVTAPGSGYFYGGEGWYRLVAGGGGTGADVRAHFVGGVVAAMEVVSGGSGYTAPTLAMPQYNNLRDTTGGQYTWIAIQTRRLWRLVRAAFTAAGIDPDRARFSHALQGYTIAHAQEPLNYFTSAGWTLANSIVSPTNYDNMGEFQRWYQFSHHDPYRFRTDSVDQNIDKNICYYRYHPGRHADGQVLRNWLDDNGYADIPLENYEGGIETNIELFASYYARGLNLPGGTTSEQREQYAADWTLDFGKSWEQTTHPRWRRAHGARAERMEPFTDAECSFMIGTDPNGSGDQVEMWGESFPVDLLAGVGDGSDGKFDNRTDPYAWNDIVGVRQAFLGEWNSGESAMPLELGLGVVSAITTTGFLITAPDATGGTPPYVSYRHEYSLDGIAWTDGGTNQANTITDLTHTTIYQTRVIVTDSDAATATSPVLEVKTAHGSGLLSVGPPAASLITSTSFRSTSAPPTGGGGPPFTYYHELSTVSASGPWEILHPANDQAVDFTGLAPATGYYLRLTVFDAGFATSTYGAVRLVTTLAPTSDLTIGTLTSSALTSSSVTITAPAAAGGDPPITYRHQRYNGTTWVNGGTTLAYNWTGLSAGSVDFRVVATDSATPTADTATSATLTVTIPVGPPTLGQGTASAITDTGFTITFPDATGGTPPYGTYYHEIFLGGTWTAAGGGQSQGFSGLTAGTTYRTRGYVLDSLDVVANSPELEVTTTGGAAAGRGAAINLLRRARARAGF